ncbi:MAG: hypothetical protein CMM50_05185 [Rhodospirillaceae bacterium]|jgi:hypothetical protein|nr:hypothetical protein [Rhodospirillaceae bacterium]
MTMMLDRRGFLGGAAALAAFTLCTAHTPYRQWQVYRQRHLLILTSREDEPSYPIGQAIADFLVETLPESAARVTRAPTIERFASLISTGQLDVGVLSRALAAALLKGEPPFTAFGPTDIRTLMPMDGHLLICRGDFPDRHAYVLAAALSDRAAPFVEGGIAGADLPVPWHEGVTAFREGHPPPDTAVEASSGASGGQ